MNIKKFESYEQSDKSSLHTPLHVAAEKLEFIKDELKFLKNNTDILDGMTPDEYLNEGCSRLECAAIRIAQKLGIC